MSAHFPSCLNSADSNSPYLTNNNSYHGRMWRFHFFPCFLRYNKHVAKWNFAQVSFESY